MKLKTILCAAMPALLLIGTNLKAQTIELVHDGTRVSMRGLSVVDNNTAWVSGNDGNVGISNDGGKTWVFQQLKGYENLDFRDIEAFDAKEAVIMSSGTPAVILKTIDGGATWQEKYRKTDTSYFLDAMAFADKNHGYIMGDPISGKFLMLETKNGGETWVEMANAPVAFKEEAAFAASGTCLRADGVLTIVTGGSKSRIMHKPLIGSGLWVTTPLPLTNGNESRGAFSFAVGKSQTIIVGGNYAKDKQTDSVAYIIPEVKASFKGNLPVKGPAGYQSCVEYLKGETFLSTGTPGSNLTADGGKTWIKIDDKSYNVCRKAKKGNLVLLAGNNGKIGIYNP